MATVRPGDSEGVVPLYDFMLAFLNDGVQKKTIGDFIASNQIDHWEQVADHWQDAAWGTAGFLACLAVGVLFIVVFPIVGCCYCCCRTCCGCCQPQKDFRKCLEKGDDRGCKFYTCSSVLFILATAMTAMVACNYVVVIRVQGEVEGKTTGDITTSLGHVEQFLTSTTDDVYQAVFPPLENTTGEVLAALIALPVTAEEELARQTGIDPALYLLVNYTQSLPGLEADLDQVDTITGLLQTQALILETELATIRTNISGILSSCGPPCEGSITDNLPCLTVATNYTEIANMSTYEIAVNAAVEAGIVEETEKLLENYQQISGSIQNATDEGIAEIEAEIEKAEEELLEYYQSLYNFTIDATELIHEGVDFINDVQENYISQYSMYAIAPFYVLTTLCLITCLLILIALPMALLGCGRGHVSRMLLASVGFTFALGWLFMLITVVFFAAGGATETMACRHLRTFDESAEEIARVSRNEFEDLTYNLTLKELIGNCKADQAFYTALHVEENLVNVSELLDLEGTAVEKAIIEIAGTPIDLPDVTIITDEVEAAVSWLSNQTRDIPYDTVYEATSKPVTVYDLEKYASELNEAAKEVSSPTKDEMEALADRLDQLSDTLVAQMEGNRSVLNASTASAAQVTSTDLDTIIANLSYAQEVVNKDSETIVGLAINDTCLAVYGDLESFSLGLVDSIEDDIGRCKPVYDAGNTMVQSGCAYALHPINAVWFTYGAFIALASIAVWLATSLVGMVRVEAALAKIAPSPEEPEAEFIALQPYSKDGVHPVAPPAYSPPPSAAAKPYTPLPVVQTPYTPPHPAPTPNSMTKTAGYYDYEARGLTQVKGGSTEFTLSPPPDY